LTNFCFAIGLLLERMIIPVRCFSCGKVRFKATVASEANALPHRSNGGMRHVRCYLQESLPSLAVLTYIFMLSGFDALGYCQQVGNVPWPTTSGFLGRVRADAVRRCSHTDLLFGQLESPRHFRAHGTRPCNDALI
jgi:hypothetical protein